MSTVPQYIDVHKDEPIIGECPYCHLPIYQCDAHNQVSAPKGGRPRLYHRGCSLTMRGHELETDLTHTLKLLRELGYHVDLKIIRPVV